MIGNSDNQTNFPHKLLLTDTQFSKVCKTVTNGSSANIKFSKTQLSKMIQSRETLGELLVGIPYTVIKAGRQELIKRSPELTKHVTKYFVNKGTDQFKGEFTLSEGSGIALTNNEMKFRK